MEIRENMLPVLGPKGGVEEVEALRDVIESGWWGKGPKVAQFEKEFAEMVKSIRNLEIALGNDKKKPSRGEIKNIITVRKSIKARHYIKRGEKFSTHQF